MKGIQLQFFGAAQNVTGSCCLVQTDEARVLVDCGLYQERDLRSRNWDPFPVPAASIDAVVLTHAHLDHCGRLPRLVKEGFRGPVHASAATTDIAAVIMKDAAHLQEEDVKHKIKRHQRENRISPHPYEPLYTMDDAEQATALLQSDPYEQEIPIAPGMTAAFYESGHIFGSTAVKLKITRNGESRTLLFSGDVGRWDLPIIKDPAPVGSADYVVVESTYGDRIHEPTASIPDALAEVINETRRRGGNIVVPCFAVERTQEMLFHLSHLLREKKIKPLPAFVDSPMAIRVTEIFKRHPDLFDEETLALIRRGEHPCDFPGLIMSRTVDQSKAINGIKGTVIIMAGSGMCTGGRIKHHLKNNISDPHSTVLFVGYQAAGTLGRQIVDGADEVRIFGELHAVKARIARISGFSAHADSVELLRWLDGMGDTPRKVFITHGEPKAAHAFARKIQQEKGWAIQVPAYNEIAELDG